MFPLRIRSRARILLRHSAVLQIGLLMAFWLAGNVVARVCDLPVPGAVIGMSMLLLLLASGRLSMNSARRGANFLLAEMLLFFVPACLAVLNHREFFGVLGLKLLLTIVLGTVLVMGCTALAVDLVFRWRSRHALE